MFNKSVKSVIFIIITFGNFQNLFASQHTIEGNWRIVGLGNIYYPSEQLLFSKDRMKWPICDYTNYSIISKKQNILILEIKKFQCKRMGFKKNKNYKIFIKFENKDDIKIHWYDSNNTETVLRWGEFFRIRNTK